MFCNVSTLALAVGVSVAAFAGFGEPAAKFDGVQAPPAFVVLEGFHRGH